MVAELLGERFEGSSSFDDEMDEVQFAAFMLSIFRSYEEIIHDRRLD